MALAFSTKWSEEVKRAMKGMTQLQVALKTGVSPSMIGNIQNGRIPTDLNVVRKFAEAVGEDPEHWELFAKICEFLG